MPSAATEEELQGSDPYPGLPVSTSLATFLPPLKPLDPVFTKTDTSPSYIQSPATLITSPSLSSLCELRAIDKQTKSPKANPNREGKAHDYGQSHHAKGVFTTPIQRFLNNILRGPPRTSFFPFASSTDSDKMVGHDLDVNDSDDRNSRTARTAPFKSQAKRGTTSWQLKQFAEATLGSGSLKKAVKLPEGEDENEWLAVNGEFDAFLQAVTCINSCQWSTSTTKSTCFMAQSRNFAVRRAALR